MISDQSKLDALAIVLAQYMHDSQYADIWRALKDDKGVEHPGYFFLGIKGHYAKEVVFKVSFSEWYMLNDTVTDSYDIAPKIEQLDEDEFISRIYGLRL